MSSAVALHFTAGSKLCLLVAALLVVCGAIGTRFPVSVPLRVVGIIAICLTAATFLFQLPMPRPNGFLFFPSVSYSAGLFSCLGTAILLLRRHERWEEQLVLVTTIVTLIAAGNTNYAFPYGYAVISYSIFLMLYLRSPFFRIRISTVLTTVLTLAFAIGIAAALSRGQSGFRDFMSSFQLWSTSVNFGDTAGIKPQGDAGGKKVLIRVFTTTPDHYFAARRYVGYAENQWSAATGRNVGPTTSSLFPGDRVYSVRGEVGGSWQAKSLERVEVTSLRPEALPLPLETRLVSAPLAQAQLSSCGDLLVSQTGARFSGTYELARGTLPVAEDQDLLQRCLEADVDPYVSSLAYQIAGDKNDKLKVFALQQFFQQNFEYGFGYPFDTADDPVATFLKERPAAHCEVYATCMTLMARSVGVPARYVQGFLVREQNEWGGYWVSRERDAHAWVEVYLEGVGWVTVDATPPGVSEAVESDSSWREFSDVVKRFFQRVWAHLARGPQALIQDVIGYVARHPAGCFLCVLAVFLWSVRARWKRLFKRKSEATLQVEPVHPQVSKIRDLFEEYQTLIETKKPTDMTLLEWAHDVGEQGDFLREYSRIRYSSAVPSDEDLAELSSILLRVGPNVREGPDGERLTLPRP
jgi:Transglutaminase-like superfamily